MPLYDFECKHGHRFDEFLRVDDRTRLIYCPYCKGLASRLISLPNTSKDLAWHFTDIHTTGKPVEFTSKGQWQRHLKSHGLHDDIPQRALKESDLKSPKKESKQDRFYKTKKIVEQAYLEGKKQ